MSHRRDLILGVIAGSVFLALVVLLASGSFAKGHDSQTIGIALDASRPALRGYATFYQDPARPLGERYAAAGPLLRSALGDWRGRVIRVSSGNHATVVRLVDFCPCANRQGLPTILDLSPTAFGDLAPLSAGVIRVEIELVFVPQTDMEGP